MLVIGAALCSAPALAFDGTKTDPDATLAIAAVAGRRLPLRHALAQVRREGPRRCASLEYAAEQGHPLALWKLGRMYADGDGVSA